jgi:hypothetical protein
MFHRSRPDSCPTPFVTLCCVALFLLISIFVPPAKAADESGKVHIAAVIVLGVINYTRWPQLDSSIRVCLLGESENFEGIRQLSPLTQKMTGYPSTFSTPANDHKLALSCDLLYVGKMSDEGVKTLLGHTANRPILTIGESKDFCSQGGMFCLNAESSEGSAGFAVNLDAISRSKLHVNPQVLRLSSKLNKVLP